MIRQADRTVRTGRDIAARAALDERCISAPVQEQDRLLFQLKAPGQLSLQLSHARDLPTAKMSDCQSEASPGDRFCSDPANIVATILEGRPNGMPSFRGKIPEQQVWELAAYIRSMSGLLAKDVAPGRTDHMAVKNPENETERRPPKQTATPPSALGTD